MKTLFIGGIKSGKSLLAERYTLEITPKGIKPYYLATNECFDDEMQLRIKKHKQQRADFFIDIEEPLHLLSIIQNLEHPILIECITIWLNNAIYYGMDDTSILKELKMVMQLPNTLVVVQNEVGFGIIPNNKLARRFVDLSGKAAQIIAKNCQNVFFCSAGLAIKMK